MGLRVLQCLVHDLDTLLLLNSQFPLLLESLLEMQRSVSEDKPGIIDNNSITRNQILIFCLEIGGPSEKIVPQSSHMFDIILKFSDFFQVKIHFFIASLYLKSIFPVWNLSLWKWVLPTSMIRRL